MNTDRAGLFTVDLSDAAPQPMGPGGSGDGDIMLGPTQPPIPPVVFLFKIEERSLHNISYIWMVRNNNQGFIQDFSVEGENYNVW